MVLHVAFLLSLALIVPLEPRRAAGIRFIDSPPTESVQEIDEFKAAKFSDPDDAKTIDKVQEVAEAPDESVAESVEVTSMVADLAADQIAVDAADLNSGVTVPLGLLETIGKSGRTKATFAARTTADAQRAMIKAGGGDPDEIIRAVEASCDWFKRHQLPDGGWSFDCSQIPDCMGRCGNPHQKTYLKNREAATALALLPMLGQGYTHMARGDKGKYSREIEAGLAFLAQKVIDGNGASGGGMYTQGLTALVLSEAFGMTEDQRLAFPAQAAIDYIIRSQDPNGGGWGYWPRSLGDTSIVCWQIMALKSGAISGLRVDPRFVPKLTTFLDSVQSDDGAGYGYRRPGDTASLTPAGLLCRMFTTWKKTNDALIRGAKKTAKRGPSSDMYASYYATQVLFHLKKQLPEEWDTWQREMTKMLVDAQVTAGHSAGSFFEGFERGRAPDCAGRIYVTSMATMTLEVYFKHGMPLYQEATSETDDFVE